MWKFTSWRVILFKNFGEKILAVQIDWSVSDQVISKLAESNLCFQNYLVRCQSLIFNVAPKISWQKFCESCMILLNSFTENSEWLKYHKRITSQFLFTKWFSITSKILNSFAKHRRTYQLMRKLSKNIMGNYFKAFSIPLMIFSFFAGVST